MSWGLEEVGILPNQLRAASARKESLPPLFWSKFGFQTDTTRVKTLTFWVERISQWMDTSEGFLKLLGPTSHLVNWTLPFNKIRR